jgi:hypothetical protein
VALTQTPNALETSALIIAGAAGNVRRATVATLAFGFGLFFFGWAPRTYWPWLQHPSGVHFAIVVSRFGGFFLLIVGLGLYVSCWV